MAVAFLMMRYTFLPTNWNIIVDEDFGSRCKFFLVNARIYFFPKNHLDREWRAGGSVPNERFWKWRKNYRDCSIHCRRLMYSVYHRFGPEIVHFIAVDWCTLVQCISGTQNQDYFIHCWRLMYSVYQWFGPEIVQFLAGDWCTVCTTDLDLRLFISLPEMMMVMMLGDAMTPF